VIGFFGKIGKLVPLIEVQTLQNSPDGSGMAFCGLSGFCSLCGCHFDSAQ